MCVVRFPIMEGALTSWTSSLKCLLNTYCNHPQINYFLAFRNPNFSSSFWGLVINNCDCVFLICYSIIMIVMLVSKFVRDICTLQIHSLMLLNQVPTALTRWGKDFGQSASYPVITKSDNLILFRR